MVSEYRRILSKREFEIIFSEKRITMKIFHLFIFFLLLMQVSCQTKKEETVSTPVRSDSIVVLRVDYPESSDTLRLSQIADTVFYVNLPYKGRIVQVQYLDSLIFVLDMNNVIAFNQLGELLYKIPVNTSTCFDFRPEESRFYTYDVFKSKEIKVYDFKGNELKCIRLKTDEKGFYGASFLAINDSLFAISRLNEGNNENELFFINGKGRQVGYKKNMEPFVPARDALTHNEIWPRTLFRTSEGLRYHRCYRDTLFAIQQDMTLYPLLIEQKIAKVPLEKRIECVGGNMTEYLNYCYENDKYAVRTYETSRYYIAEYLLGRSPFSLPNYLVYDKETGKLNRIELNLDHGFETHQLHFGIFNDYDGGLAFTPLYQTGDYLIMVNGGEAQGRGAAFPKALYKRGKSIKNEQYSCRSDVYRSINDKKRADAFFDNLDEREDTMLMIVKLKR